MRPRPPLLAALALALLSACATTPRPRSTARASVAAPPRAPATATSPAPPSSPSSQSPSHTLAPLAVTAPPRDPLAFDITATSDLPAAPASSSLPFARSVERALAPLKPALAECLRALGAPARRVVRLTVDEEGALHARPPQDFSLSPADARCLDGVLRAGEVQPPPPRAMPFDLRVDVGE